MQTVRSILESRISDAIRRVTGLSAPAMVQPATEVRFGDYQANGVMAVARQLRKDPRRLAADVVANARLDDMCQQVEVAGPGFINMTISVGFLAERLLQIWSDPERLGIDPAQDRQTVVVDFSSPNVAKQMHVGHLRSTIIGDCICRMLEFAGHKVIRQNHIGDWGTQFGMLIAFLQNRVDQLETGDLSDLESFYRKAQEAFDTDSTFASQARSAVVRLQAGEPEAVALWRRIVEASRRHYQAVYDLLGVGLTEVDERGESFYNPMLPHIVQELKEKGIAAESEGAVCVFLDGFMGKDGKPIPFIIQKSDGGYLYATTDLAALRFRIDRLRAQRIIYVTDARQKLHFQMLFATARKAGWAGPEIVLEHVTFGSVLGEDGRPLKTRSGGNVKLMDLLTEAIDKAMAVVEQKNPGLDPAKKAEIARTVGIGAVKYADLSTNRTSDYQFSFQKMLSLEGNTAPYMQYAYARIRSIARRAQDRGIDVQAGLADLDRVILAMPDELRLARSLVRYGEALEGAMGDLMPNYLTSYLYELAQCFSSFYNTCPVLDADVDLRPSRLLLCELTARTIRHGLGLLGIGVVEQM
ncbi:MAG: arginine--tRNA ligase [Sedimentisphaerales bacterium]|nr:arginine--tRNA ligase [Sedimentisphaerales bacterium]